MAANGNIAEVGPASITKKTRVGTFGVKTAIVVALLSVAGVFIFPNFVQEEKNEANVVVLEADEAPVPSVAFEHIPVKLDFYNRHQDALDIYWVNSDEEEVKLGGIDPGSSQEFNSFVGHVWIWRIASSQEYVRTFVVESDKITEVYSRFDSNFHEEYMKEHGYSWINVYPRQPMVKWLADPIEIGHEVERVVGPGFYTAENGIASNDTTVKVKMKTLATIPRIFVIEDFLSEDECDFIINDAKQSGEMLRSGVKMKGELSSQRTSTNMWMTADRSKVLENIFRRGFSLMNVDFQIDTWKQNSESLQVLSYEVSQEYQPHDDYFKPADYPTYKAVQEGKNRYATLFFYLSDVEEGGETVFPRMGDHLVENACTSPNGFRVAPKKGRAALFFSMLPDGNLDHNAFHGGCPVIHGQKWAANFWFWDPVSGDA